MHFIATGPNGNRQYINLDEVVSVRVVLGDTSKPMRVEVLSDLSQPVILQGPHAESIIAYLEGVCEKDVSALVSTAPEPGHPDPTPNSKYGPGHDPRTDPGRENPDPRREGYPVGPDGLRRMPGDVGPDVYRGGPEAPVPVSAIYHGEQDRPLVESEEQRARTENDRANTEKRRGKPGIADRFK